MVAGRMIAQCFPSSGTAEELEEAWTNADLVAALPDLVQTLGEADEALSWLAHSCLQADDNVGHDRVDQMRSSIRAVLHGLPEMGGDGAGAVPTLLRGEMAATGTIAVRETGKEHEGREVFSLFGLVAVHRIVGLKGEHQYPMAVGADGVLRLGVEEAVDQTVRFRGLGIPGALQEPVWKV